MVRQHLRQPLLRPVRIGSGASRFQIDTHDKLFGQRAHGSVNDQFAQNVNPLRIVVEQRETPGKNLTLQNLAHVMHMRLNDVGADLIPLHIGQPYPEVILEHVVHRLIQRDGIISHVHVAIMVDPFGGYAARQGFDWRGVGAVMSV